MSDKKIISSHKAGSSRSMGPYVKQVIPGSLRQVDPFVFLDHFGPFEKKPGGWGVPPHPHAGIATITYLFSGSNRHQDSYGHDVMVHTGDLAWMQAGKGIVHAEGMNENKTEPEIMHGLQLWISLPAKDKFIDPAFYYYPAAQLPVFTEDGASIKVICGTLKGYQSPVKTLSPAFIYELKIPAGKTISIPLLPGDTCGMYIIEGHIIADDKDLYPTVITQFDEAGAWLSLSAVVDSQLVVLGGKPLREPVVMYASYVMNTEEQIRQVMQDYTDGKMGEVL
jgi:quercetin 2,3-dioxygenase